MRRLIQAVVLATLFVSPLAVWAAPASEASIRELLEITHTRKLMDGQVGQVDGILKQSLHRQFAGESMNDKQQAIMDDMLGKVAAVFKDEMKWESLEPMFIDIYRKSFTQEELDGMLAFYKSPAGQAVIAKMPLVMQESTKLMQQRMGALMPKVIAIEKESIAKMREAKTAH